MYQKQENNYWDSADLELHCLLMSDGRGHNVSLRQLNWTEYISIKHCIVMTSKSSGRTFSLPSVDFPVKVVETQSTEIISRTLFLLINWGCYVNKKWSLWKFSDLSVDLLFYCPFDHLPFWHMLRLFNLPDKTQI